MAVRQYLQDGGFLEPAISDPLAANTATTGGRHVPLAALRADPGLRLAARQEVHPRGGGLITTAATGALTIAPSISTTNAAGTTLGTSIAQTVPASSLSGPWYLRMILICRTTGDPGGANSSMIGWGQFISGGVAATANSGLQVTFGGTSATYDHGVSQSIFLSKTLSVAGSWTTQYVDLSAEN
jgi:hypothetical protein